MATSTFNIQFNNSIQIYVIYSEINIFNNIRLSFFTKICWNMFFELFTTDFSSAPCTFWVLAISLLVGKNLFLILHGAFENNKTITLLIGLLNQDPSVED